ncbi:probable PilA2 pilus assembly protein [Fulvimarina pelagi HTCC2506]|uniref:Probable PilA2 pilus assembly protein n=2 Tax=Fulvimarina pelagi TaxID=217511 RepID=Q0G4P9_9HYPH|nr:probable PilA2 pilus assembly protein [Fulvimarina pelagi HTCC2506]
MKTKENIMSKTFARFLKNESGATAIEYALIAGMIAVGLITILGTLGSNMVAGFTKISDEVAG